MDENVNSVVLVVLVGTLATLGWRVLGVKIAGRMNLQNPLYLWFVHVSYAAVAAVLCLNLFIGNGNLDENERLLRLVALVVGLLVVSRSPKRVFYGLCSALFLYGMMVYFDVNIAERIFG